MIRNIRGHRIRWRILLAQGSFVGVLSALVMLAVAMVSVPAFSASTDMWSFSKAMSTVVLGADAATPLTGFVAGPVILGTVLHLAYSALAGVVYAGLVGMFDLEGWTPVAVMGLVFGAILFVWTAVLIGAGIAPSAVTDLPLGALLWGNISFGLTAGLLLATWADRADLDHELDDAVRVHVFEGDDLSTGLPL